MNIANAAIDSGHNSNRQPRRTNRSLTKQKTLISQPMRTRTNRLMGRGPAHPKLANRLLHKLDGTHEETDPASPQAHARTSTLGTNLLGPDFSARKNSTEQQRKVQWRAYASTKSSPQHNEDSQTWPKGHESKSMHNQLLTRYKKTPIW